MVTLNSVPEPNNEKDPRYHAQHIQRMLREVMDHAREDVSKVDDPKAQALYETTAEVLGGLATAYEHYLQRSEEAWR